MRYNAARQLGRASSTKLRLVSPVTLQATADPAPTLSSATVNAAGTTLTLAFSEAVQFGAGGNGGFVATFTLGALTLTYASGTGTSSLVYNSSRTIYKTLNETGTLDYTQPGNGVEDLTGNDLVSFSGTAITNNSTQTYTPPTAGNAKHGGRIRTRARRR